MFFTALHRTSRQFPLFSRNGTFHVSFIGGLFSRKDLQCALLMAHSKACRHGKNRVSTSIALAMSLPTRKVRSHPLALGRLQSWVGSFGDLARLTCHWVQKAVRILRDFAFLSPAKDKKPFCRRLRFSWEEVGRRQRPS